MINKKLDNQYAREHTGWAYSSMKWLLENEAKEANKKRNELLQSISGRVNSNFLGNKIGPGRLSPGCMTCGKGNWSCLFIGSFCMANCFFCPQEHKNKSERPPNESGLIFDNPEDYVDYLEKFKFKGVSFSGGEPLLKHEKILTYIGKIRERLGKGIYIWMYTNGYLIDKNKLTTLKEAGLNEMRFNVAARKYDLKAVEMAAGIIDTVTVEIPAVPEDYEILKRCLPKMKAIGVAHLNLHQLFASQDCYKQFVNRRYTFLHQPDIPVLESEMTALRLIKYSLDNNIGLAINYCCAIYKYRFQKKAYRERFQSFIRERYEGLTESGFIRRLAIQDMPANIKKFVKIFQGNNFHKSLWFFNKINNKLYFHHSLVRYIDFNKHSLIVAYFAPQMSTIRDKEDAGRKEIALNSGRTIFIERTFVHEIKIKNPVTINGFQELFIEKINNGDVFKTFYKNFKLKTKEDVAYMINEKEQLDHLKTLEFIGSGLYELY